MSSGAKRDALAATQGFDRAAALRTAEKMLRVGQLEPAIEQYEQVVRHCPDDFATAASLGNLYLRAGATDRAVEHFALVRMSSVTHSVNTDQRRIPLSFSGAEGNYQLSIPVERGVVLPGNYMLFALDAKGVPSVARTLNIQ